MSEAGASRRCAAPFQVRAGSGELSVGASRGSGPWLLVEQRAGRLLRPRCGVPACHLHPAAPRAGPPCGGCPAGSG